MKNNMSNSSFALSDIDPSIALVQARCNDRKHRRRFRQTRQIGVPSVGNRSIRVSKGASEKAASLTFAPFLLLSFLLLAPATSFAQVACKPFVSIKSVREVRASSTPALPWSWNATMSADARYCVTLSGTFEVDFVRAKENSPDLQFTEKFRWSRGQFDVSMELTSDEAIREFRIGFIAPCVCREISQLANDPRLK